MVELHVGKPGIAIVVLRDRRIVFLLRRLSETERGRHAVDGHASSQAVNAFAVDNVRSAELEISLGRGERELTAFCDALSVDDEPVRYDRGSATKGGAGEPNIRVRREVKELAIDIIAGDEFPRSRGEFAGTLCGERSVPACGVGVGHAE